MITITIAGAPTRKEAVALADYLFALTDDTVEIPAFLAKPTEVDAPPAPVAATVTTNFAPIAAFAPPPPAEPVEVTNANPPQLDARGFPWDARIHSQGKTIIASGAWRDKKGVEDAVRAAVEAELRAIVAAPAAPAPIAVTPPAPPVGNPFQELMTFVSPLLVSKQLSQEQIQQVVIQHGVPHVGALFQRPDLIPSVRAAIEGLLT